MLALLVLEHVSFLAPWQGMQRLRSNSVWAGLFSFTLCLFSPSIDFSFHKTHVFSPGVEEGRGSLIQFYKNVLSFMIVGTVL